MNTAIAKAVSFVRFYLPVLLVLGGFALGVPAMAQESGLTVTDVVPAADFTSAITNIGTTMGTVIKAAVGLALGIFIVGFLYGIVRKFVKK
ncbi:hypothetical protein [Planctomicrobium sp. SH527]|uniref:hypothetical protein n=1 Tax=Planctomicrobium sp. SH527 TaxID=3448123 RepID=UPI003F5C0B1F